ncbi:MAG: crotonase/enoyl-CoA hydratase family protein [Planctomycetes bacterium]|nr:crotonase/enoyl-CoA hydratase family protein [Planctomycetota bacterium]
MSEHIRTLRHGHILQIEVARPKKRNALTWEMARALNAAYTELSEDPELRCGVVHAVGDHFTGGLDLMDVAPRLSGVNSIEGLRDVLLEEGQVDAFGLLGPPCKKPVIVAVQGRCFTWGIELSLAAEICIAAEDTLFQQNEVSRGIFPFGGASFRMPARFGWGNAMRYLLTGEAFDAQEAKRLGLVQEVVPTGQQLERALELAAHIAQQAPLAIEVVLRTARTGRDQGEQAGVAEGAESMQAIMSSEDAKEGVMSLMEKRPAVFKGR